MYLFHRRSVRGHRVTVSLGFCARTSRRLPRYSLEVSRTGEDGSRAVRSSGSAAGARFGGRDAATPSSSACWRRAGLRALRMPARASRCAASSCTVSCLPRWTCRTEPALPGPTPWSARGEGHSGASVMGPGCPPPCIAPLAQPDGAGQRLKIRHWSIPSKIRKHKDTWLTGHG